MAKVEKITAEELKKAQQPSQETKSKVNFSNAKKTQLKNYYINKLSIEDIKNFFDKFGIISIAKVPFDSGKEVSSSNPAFFVYVQCEDFDVTFNDFESTFLFNNQPKNPQQSQSNNFYLHLAKYCDFNDLYPDQAIRMLMAKDLFGEKFPSYATTKKEFDEQARKSALLLVPHSMKKDLRFIDEMKQSESTSIYNKLTYGDCNIEEYIKKTFS